MFENFFDYEFLFKILVRSLAAVIIGVLIGSERARHGRAAGMRTHILVCLGAALTSMTGIYVSDYLGSAGDPLRISAQVISGIGFLGAGMIILKNNNTITGLTTAAGIWTTSVIGIAIGYGFYSGAIITTALLLAAIILFTKFEKHKKNTEVIYLEINDMYRTNAIISEIGRALDADFSYQICAPKSTYQGNLGINLIIKSKKEIDINSLLENEGVVFAEEEL